MKLWLFAMLGAFPSLAANQILLRYLNIGDHGVGWVLTADRSGNIFAVTSITDVSGVSKTRVIKTDPNGAQLASFDFGSSFPQAATTDAQGNVVLVGAISPSPVATAAAAFVMKLDSQLHGIVFTKLLGAPSWAYSVALDASGNIFVGGQTTAQNLPVTANAFQSTPPVSTEFGGPAYGFLTELSPDGSNILYSTYFGGNNGNCGAGGGSDCIGVFATTSVTALAIDKSGALLMAGSTDAIDLPVTPGALAGTCVCSSYNVAGFVTKFSPGGSPQLIWSTFLNDSSQFPGPQYEQINALALDSSGDVIVGGVGGFPTTPGVIEPVLPDSDIGTAGFILKLNNTGTSAIWSTYFGDSVQGLAVDPQGNIIVTGSSDSNLLPGSINSSATQAGYAARITSDATAILNSTVGPRNATGQALALSPDGHFATLGQAGSLWIETAASGGSLLATANAASGPVSGLVAPYELISLYGVGIGPANPIGGQVKNGAFTTSLGGYQVLFDGVAAPLLYAGPSQINTIVPSQVALEDSTHIQIVSPSATINGPTLYVRPAEPSVFESDVPGFDGFTFVAALNQDGTPNSQQNPAKTGSIVTIFATGTGPTPSGTGQIVSVNYLHGPELPVAILWGSESLEVTYAGDAPGLVAGVTQINFRLPADVGPNYFTFNLQVGAALAQGFNIAVP